MLSGWPPANHAMADTGSRTPAASVRGHSPTRPRRTAIWTPPGDSARVGQCPLLPMRMRFPVRRHLSSPLPSACRVARRPQSCQSGGAQLATAKLQPPAPTPLLMMGEAPRPGAQRLRSRRLWQRQHLLLPHVALRCRSQRQTCRAYGLRCARPPRPAPGERRRTAAPSAACLPTLQLRSWQERHLVTRMRTARTTPRCVCPRVPVPSWTPW